MHPATLTYWLEPTEQVAVGLRRYTTRDGDGGWSCGDGWHEALVFTGVEPAAYRETDGGRRVLAHRPDAPHDDERWPVECAKGCGYRFTADDVWQMWQEQLYRRGDTGQVVSLRPRRDYDPPDAPASAPPGAMWDAWWMADDPGWRGPDGMALMVRLPDGHDWHVDGEATNCTRKGDRSHKCWVRHGDPRTGRVTVGKDGETCAAGAGSIASHGYHGFLRDGVLTAG